MDAGVPIEDATLANVAEGELERQFQRAKQVVIDCFANIDYYEHTSGVLRVPIQAEIVWERDAETGVVTVSARAWPKPPKSKPVVRGAFVKDGRLLVEGVQQDDMFEEGGDDGKVTPIKKGGGE